MFLKKGTDPTKAHSRASVVTFGYMTQIDNKCFFREILVKTGYPKM